MADDKKNEVTTAGADAPVVVRRTSPVQFFQQVMREARKVTWPTLKETGYTTGAVFVMVALTMMFFFLVDTVLAYGERLLIGAAG